MFLSKGVNPTKEPEEHTVSTHKTKIIFTAFYKIGALKFVHILLLRHSFYIVQILNWQPLLSVSSWVRKEVNKVMKRH